MIKSFDVLFILLALAVFSWGTYKRVRLWHAGQKEDRHDRIWLRIKSLLIEGIGHRRLLDDPYPGLLHLLIFLGFVIPFTVIVLAQFIFTLPQFFSRVLSLTLDLIAMAAIVSIILFMIRRTINRPSRLDNRPDDLTVLLLVLAILLTGLVFEGLRLSVIGKDTSAWAPAGNALAVLVNALGLTVASKAVWASVIFRIHFFLVLFIVAYIPYSKLFHIISSPANMVFRSLTPKGALSYMDLEDEEAESFGVAKIEEFTWKQLLDLDACTRCGRCQDHCPAHLTEKPLSPKKLITDLKDHMHNQAPQIFRGQEAQPDEALTLVGDVIEEDVLWACTTCRSCMEHCPVYIEHVDKIIDLRRYRVLMESRFPEELTAAFRGLEKNSNPWGLGNDIRSDWVKELDVPILSELDGEDIEYLFFVGCIRSYDDRNKKVAIATARVLSHLGIKFAILGMEEGCCGDPARRVGNEYLFQILAQTNIETFNRYDIKGILTTCPHCYNTLKFEYPQLGFKGAVIHHAEFLQEKIMEGRLKPEQVFDKRVTYHDPCYLGRYNGIYNPPREVIKSISQSDIKEMKRSRVDALCCGAGGGWMWMDEKIGQRINLQRLEDALSTDPEWIATACPFCVTMFHDAIKDRGLEDNLKIWDIIELVDLALKPEGLDPSET